MITVRRGFTIVELIITITIMGILLTLAVVNVGTTQAKSRDEERKADIDSIAINLESFYMAGADGATTFGHYPSTSIAASATALKAALRDADMKSFMAPGVTDSTQTFVGSTNTGTALSIQTAAGVLPQPTISQYVYQPIKSDGSVCVSTDIDCRKFNLYYRLETDNTIYKVTSKNQ